MNLFNNIFVRYRNIRIANTLLEMQKELCVQTAHFNRYI